MDDQAVMILNDQVFKVPMTYLDVANSKWTIDASTFEAEHLGHWFGEAWKFEHEIPENSRSLAIMNMFYSEDKDAYYGHFLLNDAHAESKFIERVIDVKTNERIYKSAGWQSLYGYMRTAKPKPQNRSKYIVSPNMANVLKFRVDSDRMSTTIHAIGEMARKNTLNDRFGALIIDGNKVQIQKNPAKDAKLLLESLPLFGFIVE